MIGVVDYGLGNLRSVHGALEFLRAESIVSGDPSVLSVCDKLILPGVGSFRVGMQNIHERGLFSVLRNFAETQRKPLLGICLGMQLLADSGEEDGHTPGLGLISGSVERFPESSRLPVPHVGFNTARFIATDGSLFARLGEGADFYFVHSFRFVCTNAADVAALCDYGGTFAAAVRRDRIHGTQFHPEKSQTNGLRVLKNFIDL